MEPIPSILAWPGSGAPVQGAGGQSPVAGQELATGFANELDSLAALLDFAGEKEATPDGQTASATQLDLIAALVAQSLPQQFAVVAPTTDGQTSPSVSRAPVPTVSTVSTVTPTQPSLAAAAQLAVVTDLAQIVDPGAFAQMQFSLPSPVQVGTAPVPAEQTPVKATPAAAVLQAVTFAVAAEQVPATKALITDKAGEAKVEQTPQLESGSPVMKLTASSRTAQLKTPEQLAAPVQTTAPETKRPKEEDNRPITATKPDAQPSSQSAPANPKEVPVSTPQVPVATSVQKTSFSVAPAQPENVAVQLPVNQQSTPIVAEQVATVVSEAPQVAAPAQVQAPVANVAAKPEEVDPTTETEKPAVLAVAEKAAVVIKSGPGKDVFEDKDDIKLADNEPKTDSRPEPQAPVHLGVRDVKVEVADAVKDKVQVVRHVREAVADTIRDLVEAKRPGQMVLRLQPEDLGTVTVTVKTLGPKVDADVTASDPHLRSQLAQHRHDLVASVERRGLQMGEFTVGQERAAWDASQHAGHRQQQGQPMRNDFEQASRLAGQPLTSQLAAATYAVSATDSVDYVV